MENTKICTKCGRELPLEMFRWKNKSQGKKHSQCKDCQSTQEHQHYLESKERRNQIRERADWSKENNTTLVDKYRSYGCKKCGEKRFYVIDFHHRDPIEKDGTINHMIKSATYDKLKKELDKCDPLCANCHREWHYLEQNSTIKYEDWLNG